MTTDPTPLQERIEQILAEHPIQPPTYAGDAPIAVKRKRTAARIAEKVAAEVRKGQADALREAAESTRPGVDMNPTTMDGNWDYMWWTRYLAGLDSMWRSRLREAADRIEKED